MPKVRADQLVVERGLADNRTKAQALIIAGSLFSGERRIEKPGQLVADDTPLEMRGGGAALCVPRRVQAGSWAGSLQA